LKTRTNQDQNSPSGAGKTQGGRKPCLGKEGGEGSGGNKYRGKELQCRRLPRSSQKSFTKKGLKQPGEMGTALGGWGKEGKKDPRDNKKRRGLHFLRTMERTRTLRENPKLGCRRNLKKESTPEGGAGIVWQSEYRQRDSVYPLRKV